MDSEFLIVIVLALASIQVFRRLAGSMTKNSYVLLEAKKPGFEHRINEWFTQYRVKGELFLMDSKKGWKLINSYKNYSFAPPPMVIGDLKALREGRRVVYVIKRKQSVKDKISAENLYKAIIQFIPDEDKQLMEESTGEKIREGKEYNIIEK